MKTRKWQEWKKKIIIKKRGRKGYLNFDLHGKFMCFILFCYQHCHSTFEGRWFIQICSKSLIFIPIWTLFDVARSMYIWRWRYNAWEIPFPKTYEHEIQNTWWIFRSLISSFIFRVLFIFRSAELYHNNNCAKVALSIEPICRRSI